jgi:hypothetical protein
MFVTPQLRMNELRRDDIDSNQELQFRFAARRRCCTAKPISALAARHPYEPSLLFRGLNFLRGRDAA